MLRMQKIKRARYRMGLNSMPPRTVRGYCGASGEARSLAQRRNSRDKENRSQRGGKNRDLSDRIDHDSMYRVRVL